MSLLLLLQWWWLQVEVGAGRAIGGGREDLLFRGVEEGEAVDVCVRACVRAPAGTTQVSVSASGCFSLHPADV